MEQINYTESFESQFNTTPDYIPVNLELGVKLQKTREALQESISENDTLRRILEIIFSEIRVENSAITELLSQIKSPLFRNIPLPKNPDSLSLSEKAGYSVYYMKFMGFAARKASETYENTKDNLEGSHKSIRDQTVDVKITRTGNIKMPELEGVKELKRGSKTTAPPTPPSTPPKQEAVSPTAGRNRTK